MTPPREPDARKIDAEVAEKVMGWTRRGYYRDPALENDPLYDIWFDYPNSTYMQDVRAWHPSANIADAMAVLEKMRERGCVARIENNLPGAFEVTFFLIHKRIHPDNEFYQAADTLPMAIALCALRAVGAERKDGSEH